jgi:hypothetical protein
MAKPQQKQIAYCGLVCTDCGAYIATIKNDDTLRQAQAEKWARQYNIPIMKVSDVNCTGCDSKGVRMGHCAVCQIRTCAKEKGLKNCGYCLNYPCAQLEFVIKHYPVARERLDAIKQGKK